MSGRRSHQRFTISSATEGTLRVLRDVLVERTLGDDFVAIGRHAGVIGETLRMEAAEAPEGALLVRVIESRPVVTDGTMRHRLLLRLADASPATGSVGSDTAPVPNSVQMLAVLIREIPVRVLNCSSSGSLLECPAPIELSTVASLRLVLQEEELIDHLQVVRCRPIEGGSSYHVGGEFLWTIAPTRQSLRVGIGRHLEQPQNFSANAGR
jgi:hypothetical protein